MIGVCFDADIHTYRESRKYQGVPKMVAFMSMMDLPIERVSE